MPLGDARQALASLRAWGQDLLDLFFPPRCASCGRLGAWFCDNCRQRLSWLVPPLCPGCGYPLPSTQRCPCGWPDAPIPAVIRSAVFFEGPIRQAIHLFKYEGRTGLAAPLTDLLVTLWQQETPAVEAVVPLPLHPKRAAERGFNQATLLARALARTVGIPVCEGVLLRVRETMPQVGLTVPQRHENVRQAFRCASDALAGRTVLLVDDVCTTGATLQAAAQGLRTGGAARVWAFTVARARRSDMLRTEGAASPGEAASPHP